LSERLFISYANHPFMDNPENIGIVFQEIANVISDELFARYPGVFVFNLVEFIAKLNDPQKASRAIKELISKKNFDLKKINYTRMAYGAVYGYLIPKIGCNVKKEGCFPIRNKLNAVLKSSGLDLLLQLKCHECCQLSFVAMLKSLTRGEYAELNELFAEISREHDREEDKFFQDCRWARVSGKKPPDRKKCLSAYNPGNNPILRKAESIKYQNAVTLNNHLRFATDCLRIKMELSENGELKRKTQFISSWEDDYRIGKKIPCELETRFNWFVRKNVGYSLAEFIMSDDLGKLKLCELCNRFFISKRKDKRIKYCPTCSPKNKMPKEVRRKYVKKYYWDNKDKKGIKVRELNIQSLMDNLGCTREEAENIIEADSKI